MAWLPPTDRQHGYIAILRKQHRLESELLDRYCEATFGKPYGELSRSEVSSLIETMQTWETLPAELQRMRGQLDLFPIAEGTRS